MKSHILSSSIVILLLALFSCFSLSSLAQKDFLPGYLLTLDMDTLFGQIDLQTIPKMCRTCIFRTDKNTEPVIYSPGEIIGYRFIGGRYFVSRTIEIEGDTQLVFFEFLVDGISDLYYFETQQKDYYFLEKDTTGPILLSYEEINIISEYGDEKVRIVERYKGVLKYTFRDDPDIFPEIDNINFNHKSLIDITTRYHTDICPDETCLVFAKSTTDRFFIGPKVGYRYSVLGYSTSSSHAKSVNLEFGVQFRILPLKISQRWNTLINLMYGRNEFLGDFPNTITDSRESIYRIHLKYNMIRIPLSMEYSFAQKNIRPVVLLGIENVFMFNTEYSVFLLDRSNPINYLNSKFQKYNPGLLVGIGMYVKLDNDLMLSLKGEFCYRVPPADINHPLDYVNYQSCAIYLGIEYRLHAK